MHHSENQLRKENLQTPSGNPKRGTEVGFVSDPKVNEKAGSVSESKLEIYLIYDKADTQHVFPVMQIFRSHGFAVTVPVFEGEILDIRKLHIAKLVTFDIAIIYRKQVNEQWLRVKVSDLLKSPGYGRKKQILEKIIITDESSIIDRAYYENYGFILIAENQMHDSSLIDELLAKSKNQG